MVKLEAGMWGNAVLNAASVQSSEWPTHCRPGGSSSFSSGRGTWYLNEILLTNPKKRRKNAVSKSLSQHTHEHALFFFP